MTEHSTKQQKMDEILGRALRDKEFRQRLVENPKSVAQEGSLTEDEMELIAGGFSLAYSTFSRLGPGAVSFCTSRICNEGSASNLGGAVSNPAVLTNTLLKR